MRETHADINYLRPGQARPVYYASQGGADAAIRVGAEFDTHSVTVSDIRLQSQPVTLDQQGFCLLQHRSAITDFYDLEKVRPQYEKEIKALVLGTTGGKEALVFDHTLRSDSAEVRGQRTTREPASVIHNDYTDQSAAKRLRDLLPANEASQRLAHRFAIVNVWRPVNNPAINSPLTLCDFSTCDPADFVACERRAADRIGELELVTYNTQHRWYYASELQTDEVLLIKTFDSIQDGTARRVAHTAFDNPLAPGDAPPRESIESRMLVFFD